MRYILLCLAPIFLQALPVCQEIVSGDVQMRAHEKEMHIHASDGSLIRWEQFSIDGNESVHFLQPHSDAIVLNRVVGPHPSLIEGALKATGKVLLINPSGVIFGSESSIDVQAITASALDIQEKAYLDNRQLLFSEKGGALAINGCIRANEIELFGSEIFAREFA